MDLLTLFFIALVVFALVWFYASNKEDASSSMLPEKKEGEGEFGELDAIGGDISEAP